MVKTVQKPHLEKIVLSLLFILYALPDLFAETSALPGEQDSLYFGTYNDALAQALLEDWDDIRSYGFTFRAHFGLYSLKGDYMELTYRGNADSSSGDTEGSKNSGLEIATNDEERDLLLRGFSRAFLDYERAELKSFVSDHTLTVSTIHQLFFMGEAVVRLFPFPDLGKEVIYGFGVDVQGMVPLREIAVENNRPEL